MIIIVVMQQIHPIVTIKSLLFILMWFWWDFDLILMIILMECFYCFWSKCTIQHEYTNALHIIHIDYILFNLALIDVIKGVLNDGSCISGGYDSNNWFGGNFFDGMFFDENAQWTWIHKYIRH